MVNGGRPAGCTPAAIGCPLAADSLSDEINSQTTVYAATPARPLDGNAA
jgi:hypothetical protein